MFSIIAYLHVTTMKMMIAITFSSVYTLYNKNFHKPSKSNIYTGIDSYFCCLTFKDKVYINTAY